MTLFLLALPLALSTLFPLGDLLLENGLTIPNFNVHASYNVQHLSHRKSRASACGEIFFLQRHVRP